MNSVLLNVVLGETKVQMIYHTFPVDIQDIRIDGQEPIEALQGEQDNIKTSQFIFETLEILDPNNINITIRYGN